LTGITQNTRKMSYIQPLPPKNELESKAVLRKTAEAHRFLAELKGISASIPNQQILIDTLSLQEARESSAIENIISTFDDVYQSNWAAKSFASPQAKEVQFESIHPFYDGNGRTGRIINILYLIKNDLLTLPVLYMSRYIIHHKGEYYKLLQEVRDTSHWENGILFMLDAVAVTARESTVLIHAIRRAMQHYKQEIREKASKLYSQDILNNLFRHPYTKIEYLMKDLQVSRNTAIRYLDSLIELNLVEKKKIGRDNFYLNKALVNLLIAPFSGK
jgi:Fic family protein